MAIPSYAIPDDGSNISTGNNKIPSYAIPEDDTENNSSFLDNALDFLVPGASDFSKHPEHILGAAKTLAESVPAGAAQSVGNLASSAMPFSPQSNILNQAAQAVPTPSPQTSNALSAAANVIPTAKSLEGISDLGISGGKALLKKLKDVSFIKNVSGQNIEDAVQKFGADAKNTLNDLFGESKISPQDDLEQDTHEALQKMYGTPDYKNVIGKENQILSQDVFNAHKKNYEEGSARFENTLSNNNAVISPQDAYIKPSEGKKLDQIMQMDPLLADKIITANQTPNLRNLHEVQSQMGAMIADKKSVPYSQRDNESINLLSNFRDKIINNISNYAPQYKDDQAFWKNNVIPYYQNSAINKLVRTGVTPSNISNILSKPELADQPNKVPGTVNTILRHLTPEQKQYIPLSKLSGSQTSPLLDLNGNINAENFAKNSQGLTSKNISQFITPEMKTRLQGLGEDLKNVKLHQSITNNVQDIAGNVAPKQLIKNLQGLDLKLITPSQRASLQQSLSKLNDSSENIEKEKLKTESIKKILSKLKRPSQILGSGLLAGAGFYKGKELFEGGKL